MQARRQGRTAAAGITIDGEAVVLERHAGAASTRPQREPEPTNDNRASAAPMRRPEPRPDLVFPGRVRWPAKPAGEPTLARIGWAGGLAAAALPAVAAVALLGRPGAPAPEPSFELTETRTAVSVHRDGPVLAVEGRIRNVSGVAATPPDVTIRLEGADGGLFRSVQPGAAVLRSGASVFFHSTLALPSATSGGTIAVSLVRTAEGSPAR